MGYPENILVPGERILVHSHPHWKTLFFPTIIFLLATLGLSTAAGYLWTSDWNDTLKLVLLIALAVLWVGISFWFFIRPLSSWRTTHFVITDHRVTYRDGIVTRSGSDIPISRINSVEYRHGLIPRILGSGTLIIESASDEPLEFHNLPKVEKIRTLLYTEAFEREDRER